MLKTVTVFLIRLLISTALAVFGYVCLMMGLLYFVFDNYRRFGQDGMLYLAFTVCGATSMLIAPFILTDKLKISR